MFKRAELLPGSNSIPPLVPARRVGRSVTGIRRVVAADAVTVLGARPVGDGTAGVDGVSGAMHLEIVIPGVVLGVETVGDH